MGFQNFMGRYERDVVHRMNEGYRAWGVLKSVLSNRGLWIKSKKCLYEGVIIPTSLCRAVAWGMRSEVKLSLTSFNHDTEHGRV